MELSKAEISSSSLMMAALGQLIPKSLREMRDDGCVRAYWDVMDQCDGTQIFWEADFSFGGGGKVSKFTLPTQVD